jgi:erythromycin esterase-like protein
MIVSKETAHRIWAAHKEIETARKLLADIAEETNLGETPFDRDRRRHYQLGVPTSPGGHRLFMLAPELAAQVIQQHIAAQEEELRAASMDALAEIEEQERRS